MNKGRSKKWFKVIALAVALTTANFQTVQLTPFFISSQSAFAQDPDPVVEFEKNIPTKPVSSDSSISSEPQPSEPLSNDINFLVSDSPLSPADSESVEVVDSDYVTEVYETAASGLDELQEGTPVAYVAEKLTIQDLQIIREYKNEVGLLVVGDQVVIFSTGDEHFIRSLDPVRSLVESEIVSLSAHFHAEGGPSDIDLHEGSGREYVISVDENGREVVWVHENGVVIDQISYSDFIELVNNIRTKNQTEVDLPEVRSALNEYLADMDRYRAEMQSTTDGVLLGDSILYANTAGATLPEPPSDVRTFEAFPDEQNNSITPVSFEEVHWNYDVARSNSWAALNLQWTEGQDFTQYNGAFPVELAIDQLVGLPSEVPLIIELVDSSNGRVQFLIKDLATIFQTFVLPFNHPDVPADFKMNSVVAINFVFAQAGKFGIKNVADQSGILKVKLNGLPFISAGNPNAQITFLPTVTPSTFNSTDDFDNPTATVTTQVLSKTFMTATYNGTKPESFGGVVFNYDNPVTPAVKESINLDAVFPDDIVFQIDSPESTPLSFEIKDANGKTWKVDLLNITTFGQKYIIDRAHILGIDRTKVTQIVLVFEGQGTKTIKLSWGRFSSISPDDPA
ncbi:MAG: hypothetical protein HYS55_02590, partial [Candidatus Omnitrophica bacterium]|nr:hypothetical protein [Candidatus Omnitrophota bacterium]